MVNVTIKEHKGKILGFTYEGHAGYAKHGSDIVCSALTAQIMMTINGITDVLNKPIDLSYDNDGGYLSFTLDNKTSEDKTVQVLLKTLKLGIENLLVENGNYITLIKEEV